MSYPSSNPNNSTILLYCYLTERGYRVLAVDMDSQANMVQMIANTDDFLQYENKTIKQVLSQMLG